MPQWGGPKLPQPLGQSCTELLKCPLKFPRSSYLKNFSTTGSWVYCEYDVLTQSLYLLRFLRNIEKLHGTSGVREKSSMTSVHDVTKQGMWRNNKISYDNLLYHISLFMGSKYQNILYSLYKEVKYLFLNFGPKLTPGPKLPQFTVFHGHFDKNVSHEKTKF